MGQVTKEDLCGVRIPLWNLRCRRSPELPRNMGIDDKKRIQKLRGFIALCDLCHHVKHLGRASQLARQGSLDMEKVIEHFMEVNGCDRKTFDQHKKEAKAQWEKRSQSPWECDFGKFAPSGFNK